MDKDKDKSNFLDNLKARKKWWLTPILIIVLILISLIVFGKNPNIAPFIYGRF